ncbi:hypothetical protein V6N13_048134 [Hibiscus sabdariffa]
MTQSEIAPSPADPSLQQPEAVRTVIDASGGSTAVSTESSVGNNSTAPSGGSGSTRPYRASNAQERLWRGTRTVPVETRLHESPDVGSSSAVAGMNVDSSMGVDSTCQAPISSPESNASRSFPTVYIRLLQC